MWLIDVVHDSFMLCMTHWCCAWLIDVVHDSFMLCMTYPYDIVRQNQWYMAQGRVNFFSFFLRMCSATTMSAASINFENVYQSPHIHAHTIHTYATHSYEHTLSHTHETHTHTPTHMKQTLTSTPSITYETHTLASTCFIRGTVSLGLFFYFFYLGLFFEITHEPLTHEPPQKWAHVSYVGLFHWGACFICVMVYQSHIWNRHPNETVPRMKRVSHIWNCVPHVKHVTVSLGCLFHMCDGVPVATLIRTPVTHMKHTHTSTP